MTHETVAGIHWRTTFDDAVREARAHDRFALIDFFNPH
jgi:hypothetical protein